VLHKCIEVFYSTKEGANMSKEIESPAPDAERDALNEEQTVATMEKAANSPRNDVASRRIFLTTAGVAAASLPFVGLRESVAQEVADADDERLVIKKQGSFMVGGTVFTAPGTFDPTNPTVSNGQTFHGDHAYVQFQIPPNARNLPLVLWHGGGQFSKTWESTPDGREGYQTIFLRRGWAVYMLDQPRRGRAGRSTEGITITPTPGEQATFSVFRLGIWPNFFPGVQFPRDATSLDQYWRQQTPDTGPGNNDVTTDAVAALFDRIGPAVLVTHSASGVLGWLTAIKSGNVKAIVAYEPGQFVFPDDNVPPTPPALAGFPNLPVPRAAFDRLTKIPIQIIFGDNIPTSLSPIPGLERWRLRLGVTAPQFRDAVNHEGGDVSILHLPDIAVFGNTHFAFSDLNHIQIADLLSEYLQQHGLDRR
jgi:hypothetical protein